MSAYVLGIDLGGTAAKLGLISSATLRAPPSASPQHLPPPPFLHRAPLPRAQADRTPATIVALLLDACSALLAQAGVDWERVEAVGIGFPGHVKRAGSMAAGAANLSDEWKAGVPLVNLLKEGFERQIRGKGDNTLFSLPPIVLLNDADAALAAETWGGAAQGHKDVVMLTLGTGIGMAVWLNGQAWSGSRGLVEGGHMVVEKGGRGCGCGQKGCLEMYASATAVVQRAKELGFKRRRGYGTVGGRDGRGDEGGGGDGETRKTTQEEEEVGPETEGVKEEGVGRKEQDDNEKNIFLTAKHVFDAAFASPSDPVAVQCVDEAADYLGLGCLNLVRVLDPGLVLFAGGMSGAGPQFVSMVKKRFGAYGWSILPHDVEMKVAALGGEQAGVWGAARAAAEIERSFHNSK